MSNPGDAMAGRDDDLQQLASEYVLGTLDAAARRAVQVRLAEGDAPLRAAVDGWEARLSPLSMLAPAQDVPPALWDRIERGLAASPTAPPPTTGPATSSTAATQHAWGHWWNNLALWRGLAAAGLAAALLLGIRPGLLPSGEPVPQYVVVLVAPGGQAPGWVVQVSAPSDLSLTPLARTDMPADKTLELWTKADDWAAPVSLGLVRPGQPLRLQLDKLPPMQPNQLFEITLEPPTGSPTGRPTGPIQYIGRAVRLNS